ncbi:MAG: methyltransferase domain-containing protein [Nanoarchaeota archaeon]|nr:methyltransferase domain-containing protein [Nanoarchaeota archaeon]
MLDKQTQIVQKKYDRFSRFYDLLEGSMEKYKFSRWRKDLLSNLKGKILEVGVGTGKNLSYYDKNAEVIGIDLSPKMLKKAKIRLTKLNNPNITLMQMDAQKLEFKDNSFDYVVCTFVLCSVPDPVKVLREMKQVCKKKGKILMLEHMLSNYKIIAFFEHIHNPITKTLFRFNVNRKTIENINKAGLKIDKVKNLGFFDVFRRIEIINTE